MSFQLSRAHAAFAPLACGVKSQARGVHIENIVGNNTPFNYQNKKSFTILYTVSLATGAFVIPAVAVGLQLQKGGGSE